MSEFWKRTLTGAVFIAVVGGAILSGYISFFALLLLICILCLIELANLFKGKDYAPFVPAILISGVPVFLLLALFFMDILEAKVLYLIPPIMMLTYIIELYRKQGGGFRAASMAVAGIVYIAVSLGYFVSLAHVNGEYKAIIPF